MGHQFDGPICRGFETCSVCGYPNMVPVSSLVCRPRPESVAAVAAAAAEEY